MLWGIAVALVKDLRLVLRDPVGLVFLTLAPVVVISVAGLSLASLYGASDRFSSGTVLVVVDEDGGRIGRNVLDALRERSELELSVAPDRQEARRRLRRQAAAVALIVAAGTSDTLARGDPASLLVYTDPVKNFEVAKVREIVHELRHRLETAGREEAVAALAGVSNVPQPPGIRPPSLPGTIEIAEESVTGAPRRLNTFDQNVPGFSVTFLLLGILFGVSLGLLDERDWGTFDRLRATPTPFAAVLVAKLGARFIVGVVQMALLLAVGRLLFGISLGPEPWALALPTVGIVFAGTSFGLVVAGLAPTRESVLPLGSIAIVTMAAVGGCWWPIDLEPRWMREAALALPTTWAMTAFNDLMIRRRTVEAAFGPTAVLLAHGFLYLSVGILLLQRSSSRVR